VARRPAIRPRHAPPATRTAESQRRLGGAEAPGPRRGPPPRVGDGFQCDDVPGLLASRLLRTAGALMTIRSRTIQVALKTCHPEVLRRICVPSLAAPDPSRGTAQDDSLCKSRIILRGVRAT